MNILILNWRDPQHPLAGGAEGYLLEIGRRWVTAGHEVRWLCARHSSQPSEATLDGIRIWRRGRGYGVFVAAALTYLRRLRGWADVIVDSENGLPFFSPSYSRTPKVVLVHHIHREVFQFELPAPAAKIAAWLEGRLMPWAYRHDSFVAVSESTQKELLGLGVVGEQLAIIHNGLEHASFKPGKKNPQPTVLWLGRLKRYKAVDTVIDAAKEWPSDVRLIIAGDGPERATLERQVAELGLEDRVHFTGFVDAATRTRLLQEAHVIVQTSRKEGWGMTVIEAGACGTAVVASDVAGLRDSVRDGETGVLVPFGDAPALARAVADLLDDDERRRRLEAASVRWAAQFNWQKSAEQWLELSLANLGEAR